MSHKDRVKAFVDTTTAAAMGHVTHSPDSSPPMGILQYEFYLNTHARDLFVAVFTMAKHSALGVGFHV